jgi:toxin ParE1/3/4
VKLRVLSPALDEIADAAQWFDTQRHGLGQEFWLCVDETLQRIEKHPLEFGRNEFATSELDLRSAGVRRFNYVVHFLIEAEVQVVAVAHAARHPGYWLRRTKNRS